MKSSASCSSGAPRSNSASRRALAANAGVLGSGTQMESSCRGAGGVDIIRWPPARPRPDTARQPTAWSTARPTFHPPDRCQPGGARSEPKAGPCNAETNQRDGARAHPGAGRRTDNGRRSRGPSRVSGHPVRSVPPDPPKVLSPFAAAPLPFQAHAIPQALAHHHRHRAVRAGRGAGRPDLAAGVVGGEADRGHAAGDPDGPARPGLSGVGPAGALRDGAVSARGDRGPLAGAGAGAAGRRHGRGGGGGAGRGPGRAGQRGVPARRRPGPGGRLRPGDAVFHLLRLPGPRRAGHPAGAARAAPARDGGGCRATGLGPAAHAGQGRRQPAVRRDLPAPPRVGRDRSAARERRRDDRRAAR